MSGPKPVANLDLMAKIAGSWDVQMKKVAAKNQDLRRYMGKGGARIPAVLTRIFEVKPGPNVYSQAFECYLLNTHGAEPPESEALIQGGQQGSEQIKITVRYTPKADAPALPAGMAPVPTEVMLQSRTAHYFQTGEMDALSKLAPGQIVILNGTSARAWVPTGNNATSWGVSLDVQFVEPVHGLTLTSLYDAARGTGTSFLMPSDLHFDENDKRTRYDRTNTYFISVFAPPATADDRTQRLHRMARECGETRVVNRDWSEKTWAYKPEGQTAKIKAALDLVHTQWLPNIDIEKYRDVVVLGVGLWEEALLEFGIPDVDTWVGLAPMIFDKLDFKVFGHVDTKGTDVNFGGVESDKDVTFALEISSMGMIADIEGCYRRIGIPVTADCVLDLQQIPGGAPGGGMAIKDADFVDTLPAVVPVSGPGASSSIASKLLGMAQKEEGKLEFVALLPYPSTPAVLKGLATLTADEGSALVTALAAADDGEILGNAKVHGLYEGMATGKDVRVVAFAFCNGIIPESIKSERTKTLITYMTGKAPSDAVAIEDGAASAAASAPAPAPEAEAAPKGDEEEDADTRVAEIPDDDDDAEVDAATASASRKRSAKKMEGKKAESRKRKSKAQRTLE